MQNKNAICVCCVNKYVKNNKYKDKQTIIHNALKRKIHNNINDNISSIRYENEKINICKDCIIELCNNMISNNIYLKKTGE